MPKLHKPKKKMPNLDGRDIEICDDDDLGFSIVDTLKGEKSAFLNQLLEISLMRWIAEKYGWAVVDGWQPIETAPVNISVLIYIPGVDHYGPGVFRAIHVDMGTNRRWQTTGCGVGRDCMEGAMPTHWMPLPPTPQNHE